MVLGLTGVEYARDRMGSSCVVALPKQEPNRKLGTPGPQGMAGFPNWPWMLEVGLALQTALGTKSYLK